MGTWQFEKAMCLSFGKRKERIMWKCEKCGRTFAKKDQPHYCGKPETVDEYIEAQDEAVRGELYEMRKILKKALPDARECISWSMPTYKKGVNLIHFAASKKHIGLYPGGEATGVFEDYDHSKGTVRFPYGKKLPEELIMKIAAWCEKEYGR